jgi:hypothetical protein
MVPAKSRKQRPLFGNSKPRLAPPVPARTGQKDFSELAAKLGQPLWPWQATVSHYITALAPGVGWLYREVATVAARQNGKTSIMKPLIVGRLLAGHRIVHAAQDLKLPREMHEEIATLIEEDYPEYLPKRRGVKYGVGQESIHLNTGGLYRVVSNSRSGARGAPNDLVLVDEVLELTNMDFVAAAIPSTVARPWGQIVYFSNAGTTASSVLMWLRERADNDPALAYLEWSAEPDLPADELKGWLQANPAIGHNPVLLENLSSYYQSHLAGGTLDVWEREHLCRQTLARYQSIVTAEEWSTQEFVDAVEPSRPCLGVKMDISGERASAVIAWQEGDGRTGLEVIADVEGHPIDIDRFGPDLQKIATQKRVSFTGFDPYTDTDLAQHLRRAKPLMGRDYANASEKFVRLVAGRQFRVHDENGILATDLAATIPRATSGGAYVAIKASPETTNTAAEAAIRAVWLASAPRPIGEARIY